MEFDRGTVYAASAVVGCVMAVVLTWLGIRAQRRPGVTGDAGMVGLVGTIGPQPPTRGRRIVEVRGELWWCRSPSVLEPGMEVRVTGVDDFVLEVVPV